MGKKYGSRDLAKLVLKNKATGEILTHFADANKILVDLNDRTLVIETQLLDIDFFSLVEKNPNMEFAANYETLYNEDGTGELVKVTHKFNKLRCLLTPVLTYKAEGDAAEFVWVFSIHPENDTSKEKSTIEVMDHSDAYFDHS